MNNNTPESSYVVDTVALILRLEKRSMGDAARIAFADAEAANARLQVPAMVFAEILYLAQRKRIKCTLDDVQAYLHENPLCTETPLDLEIVATARQIADIPELHDRLIAATAIHLDVPLITNDRIIRASAHLHTLW